MTYDASDRKEVRKAEKAARQSERAREEVITTLMLSTTGRQWIWELLTSCHVFSQTFTTDPLMTAFAEGRRAVGLELLGHIMAACPDQYITAAREANVRHISNNRSANGSAAATEHSGSSDADWGIEGRIESVHDDYDIYGTDGVASPNLA